MLELYPLSEKGKELSFLHFLRKVLSLQTVILSVVVLVKGDMMSAFISLLAGIAFSIYFVSFYTKRKIRN